MGNQNVLAGLLQGFNQGAQQGQYLALQQGIKEYQRQQLGLQAKKMEGELRLQEDQIKHQQWLRKYLQQHGEELSGEANQLIQPMINGQGQVQVPALEPPPRYPTLTEENIKPGEPPAVMPPRPQPVQPMAAPQPSTAPALQAPSTRPAIGLQGYDVDAKGNIGLKFGKTKATVQHEKEPTPEGIQTYRITIGENGSILDRVKVGIPQPPESIQRLQAFAQTLTGAPVGSEANNAAVAALGVAEMYPKEAQPLILDRIQQNYGVGGGKKGTQQAPALAMPAGGRQAGGAGAGGGVGLGGILGEMRQQQAAQIGAETRAREVAQREEGRLPAEVSSRIGFYTSGETLANELAGLVEKNPHFVGKGFSQWRDEFTKDFNSGLDALVSGKPLPGGLFGGLRKFTGEISEEEVTFRQGLVDLADRVLRARSGAQTSIQEAANYRNIIGKLTDEPNVMITQLRNVAHVLARDRQNLVDTFTASPMDLRGKGSAPAAPALRATPAAAPPKPQAISLGKNAEESNQNMGKIAVAESAFASGKMPRAEFLKVLNDILGPEMAEAYIRDVEGATTPKRKKGR